MRPCISLSLLVRHSLASSCYRQQLSVGRIVTRKALQVKALAEEVLAHLREVAGSDALLAAYNRARQTVNSARNERRRQRTLQVTLASCYLA